MNKLNQESCTKLVDQHTYQELRPKWTEVVTQSPTLELHQNGVNVLLCAIYNETLSVRLNRMLMIYKIYSHNDNVT